MDFIEADLVCQADKRRYWRWLSCDSGGRLVVWCKRPWFNSKSGAWTAAGDHCAVPWSIGWLPGTGARLFCLVYRKENSETIRGQFTRGEREALDRWIQESKTKGRRESDLSGDLFKSGWPIP